VIPVFEPEIGEDEIAAVVAALRRGELSGSFGETIPTFERAFAEYCECRHGIAVSSGTTALHLAAAALGLGPGDEVLVSASTNIATALAVYHCGATVVPIDSEQTTWNLDLDKIEAAITPKTKAIFPVHLFGHPVDMVRLCKLAGTHNLFVVEDAAEAHGAKAFGRMAGSFGDCSCFSFYANKHLTTGEGGMVLTNDDALAERLRLLRNLAFTTPRFRHEFAGFNFRMTGFQAAMGIVQLRKLNAVIEAKRRLAGLYQRHLADVRGLQLPTEMPWARHVYWMYGVVVEPDFGITRDELTRRLKRDGIDTRTFFCPMNLQPCFADIPECASRSCPVAERLWTSGLYLPSSTSLTEESVAGIAAAIKAASRQ
jgi:perosamine synthetase